MTDKFTVTDPHHTKVEFVGVEALLAARDVLSYLEHTPEDLIVIAEWLLTGKADIALAFSEQRARHYQPSTVSDEMRWTPRGD